MGISAWMGSATLPTLPTPLLSELHCPSVAPGQVSEIDAASRKTRDRLSTMLVAFKRYKDSLSQMLQAQGAFSSALHDFYVGDRGMNAIIFSLSGLSLCLFVPMYW